MPADLQKEVYMGKFFGIQSSINPKYSYLYAGRVKTCRAGGCSIASSNRESVSESEFFDYYVIYDSLFTVLKVKIYSYQATHGHEVSSKGWLKQFTGYNGTRELRVNKDVDAISGATISVYAITYDIYHKTNLFREIKNK